MTNQEIINALTLIKDRLKTDKDLDMTIMDFNSLWANDIGHAIEALEEQEENRWIPCSERLPEEHDSIFADFKGTDKWNDMMFEKVSDDVNVTVEYIDGERGVMTMNTVDGKWHSNIKIVKFKVLAWRPLPKAWEGGNIKDNDTRTKN